MEKNFFLVETWRAAPMEKITLPPALLSYFLSNFALGMSVASLGPSLPTLAERVTVTLSAAGILFSARSLGVLLGSLRGGPLFDRFNGHKVLALAMLTMGSFLLLMPLLANLWLLAALMVFIGLTEGVVDVGANALLLWTYPGRASAYLNAMHFFFGVGAMLSPLIAAQIFAAKLPLLNWLYPLLAMAMLPGIVLLLRSPAPPPQPVTAENTAAHDNARRWGVLLLMLVVFFFYVGSEAGFGGWIFSYARLLDLIAETPAAYLNSLFWGALTFGRLLAVPIARRVSSGGILQGSLIGCVLSAGVLALGAQSAWAVWVATAGLGLSMAAIFPTSLAFAGEHMHLSGRITSYFFVASSFGAMLIPWLIGLLFDWRGPDILGRVLLLNLMIALLALLFANRNRD